MSEEAAGYREIPITINVRISDADLADLATEAVSSGKSIDSLLIGYFAKHGGKVVGGAGDVTPMFKQGTTAARAPRKVPVRTRIELPDGETVLWSGQGRTPKEIQRFIDEGYPFDKESKTFGKKEK